MKKVGKLMTGTIFDLDLVPNLAYFPSAIARKVRDLLSEIPGLEVSEDELAVYALMKRGYTKKPQIVIDTHLDHPGFVIDPSGRAVGLGSLHATPLVNPINLQVKQPVSFYSPEGEKIGDGYLHDFRVQGRRITASALLNSGSQKLPVNTQVLPNVKVGLKNGKFSMRSVDNIATVEVCLRLLKTLSKEREDVNVLVIFSKLEEVSQLTAVGIALNQKTPFGTLDNLSPFFVLEAAPMFDMKSNDVRLGIASTENDVDLSSANSANIMLNTAANAIGIKLVPVDIASNSDSTAYQLVGGFNRVATLLVNSQYRHNVDDNGSFGPEVVAEKSLNLTLELLVYAIHNNSIDLSIDDVEMNVLSKIESHKRRGLIRAYLWSKPRLKQGHLYPISFFEHVRCIYASIFSRIFV